MQRENDEPNNYYDMLTEEQRMYFETAMDLAEQALRHQEVPVGCVFVYDGQIIGRGMNEVNKTKNATQHAEFVAFREIEDWCKKNGKDFCQVMSNTSLFVSLEPCIMCASALYQLRIREIFYGASNPRFGGVKSVSGNAQYGHDHEMAIFADVDVERSIAMLRRFYERENPFAPDEKRKLKS